jgi:hypothetical protein
MTIRNLAAAAIGTAMAAASALADTDRYGEQKVVYHINYAGGESGDGYRAAMTNIQNHIDAVGMDKSEGAGRPARRRGRPSARRGRQPSACRWT